MADVDLKIIIVIKNNHATYHDNWTEYLIYSHFTMKGIIKNIVESCNYWRTPRERDLSTVVVNATYR